MNDRRNDRRSPRKAHNQIREWESVKTIVDEKTEDGSLPLELLVEVERPIFRNGDYGFYRVNATIKVGKFYVRLSTKAVVSLLELLKEHRNEILDAVDEIRDLNARDKDKSNGQEKRRRSRTMPPDDERLPLLDDDELAKSKTARGRSYHPGQRKRAFGSRGERR